MNSNHLNPLTKFSKLILTVCLATVTLVCLFSCDKDKDKDNRRSEQLKQKWNWVKRYDTTFYSSNSYTSIETSGQPGDYWDFGTDDTATFSGSGSSIRIGYKFIESNMTIQMQGGTIYQIRELTDSNLELYGGIQINNVNYNSHFFMKR